MKAEGSVLKKKSLTNKVLFITIFTFFIISILITVTGAALIYRTSMASIRNEVVTAAETMENIFRDHFPGDFWKDGYIYRFGQTAIVSEDFYHLVDNISCKDDIVFSLFYEDRRTFTTVVNPSGSSPVGARAEQKVITKVCENGERVIFDKVDIYGTEYMGYYIPIVSENGDISGMFFAGKPLAEALDNLVHVLLEFILISFVALGVSVVVCIVATEKMVKGLGDIRQYINKVAKGDFSASMKEKTLSMDDEIGEIGRDAEKLCMNLRDMVERDPLTMLLNRRSSRMKIDNLLENKMLYTVAMGDIDFFKKINDTYGHAAGDYVLTEVSAVLKKYASENNAFAARWGGEEFLLVFDSKTGKETLSVVSKMLEEIRSKDYCFDGSNIKVTMTFGISEVRNGDNAESAVNRADELLYDGKQNGRNRIVI